MLTVNLRQAAELVEKAIDADVPSILTGIPGIGKTSVFRQVAKKRNIACKVEDATSLDPVDARGVIVPNLETGDSFFTRPAIFPDKEDGEEGILVLDEICGCLPATQKALQTVLLERRSGKHRLPEKWVPVGTGNGAGDGAGAFSLLSSLEDRAMILNVVPDFDVWKNDFAYPNDIDHRIISFLNFREELFSTFGKRDKKAQGKSHASARSWERLSKLLKAGLKGDLLLPGAAGCVGGGPATEFIAHMAVHEHLPDIKKIYRRQYNEVPSSDKPDVLYALAGALVSFLGRLPEDLPKMMAIERFIEYAMKLPSEFCILAIQDSIPLHKEHILRSKGYGAFARKFQALVL